MEHAIDPAAAPEASTGDRRRWLVLILGGLGFLTLGVPLFLCLRRHELAQQKIRQFEIVPRLLVLRIDLQTVTIIGHSHT